MAPAEPIDLDEWLHPAQTTAPLPPLPPEPAWKNLRYTLDLHQVPMAEVIGQLADDAGLQLFVTVRLQNRLSLNVHEQPLVDILAAFEQQSRYFIAVENNTIVIQSNEYEMRTYAVGYPNMQRQTRSQIQTSLQLSVDGGSGGGSGGNQSLTEVSNTSENIFWVSLTRTIESILDAGSDGAATGSAPAGSAGSAGSAGKSQGRVIVHHESGRVMVYASRRQHRLLDRELKALMRNMYRQVLIEATVLEIELSSEQRNGVDWQAILGKRWNVVQKSQGNDFTPSFGISLDEGSTAGSITSAMIELLESFGRVRVVSQPKLMALNNQSAVLKVVDERIYFTTQVENIFNENTANTSYETTIHSVPVGFTMSITPWISENSDVILSLKPSLTRIVRMVDDPNPALAEANVTSQVPELQIREMETIMRIRNGQIGIIGGLIQEIDTQNRSGIPKLHTSPGVGWLFGTRRKDIRRSELLILLRPVVDAS
ncbi:MAG: hypothetical protein K8963_08630 [Proteobacteria bacterium]|nr:hypothetical protein [Pseudomonadota bacterium]